MGPVPLVQQTTSLGPFLVVDAQCSSSSGLLGLSVAGDVAGVDVPGPAEGVTRAVRSIDQSHRSTAHACGRAPRRPGLRQSGRPSAPRLQGVGRGARTFPAHEPGLRERPGSCSQRRLRRQQGRFFSWASLVSPTSGGSWLSVPGLVWFRPSWSLATPPPRTMNAAGREHTGLGEEPASLRQQKLELQRRLFEKKQRRKRQEPLMVQANPDAKVTGRRGRRPEERTPLMESCSDHSLCNGTSNPFLVESVPEAHRPADAWGSSVHLNRGPRAGGEAAGASDAELEEAVLEDTRPVNKAMAAPSSRRKGWPARRSGGLRCCCFRFPGVDETTSAILNYAGKRQAVLSCTMRIELPNQARICGTKGSIELPAPWYAPTTLIVNNQRHECPLPPPAQPLNFSNGTGMRYEAQHVRQCLLQGLKESPIMSLAESELVASIVDELRRQLGVIYAEDHQG
ncbi:uncharacterized protein LOC115641688 [Gopherus evgoodei]|uniref:uncharacterized protein LOC115641688 n=1 Tax=Gopherus evgoodei TaxID=1825980 RepID=UPI0011CF161C|nr:uncharacterized protein LOC115641688 [Gopherus evgoodei]